MNFRAHSLYINTQQDWKTKLENTHSFMIHYCKNTVCIAIESLARHFKQLTLKNNLVLRVLRKLRQPKIFASLQRLVQNDVSQCLCVCSVLLAIGMATVGAARCRGVAVDGGALRFANQLRSSSLQIGGGQDEAAVSTRPTTSKQPPQPPTHTHTVQCSNTSRTASIFQRLLSELSFEIFFFI